MDRPLHEKNIFGPRFVAGWVFFTAAAGFVNAAALMAGNNVVSHVTGSVTTFATEPGVAFRIGIVVLAFLIGGIVAWLLKEKLASSWLAYVLPPAGASFVLVAICALGRAGVFGEFGGDNDVKGHAFPMLTLLAFAMGLINASVGAATANKVRVTHMTGPLTDLAGHIARGELGWAALRIAKLLGFVAGAAAAAKLADRIEFDTFSVGAILLVIAVGLTGIHVEAEEDLKTKREVETGHDVEAPLPSTPGAVTARSSLSGAMDTKEIEAPSSSRRPAFHSSRRALTSR